MLCCYGVPNRLLLLTKTILTAKNNHDCPGKIFKKQFVFTFLTCRKKVLVPYRFDSWKHLESMRDKYGKRQHYFADLSRTKKIKSNYSYY